MNRRWWETEITAMVNGWFRAECQCGWWHDCDNSGAAKRAASRHRPACPGTSFDAGRWV